MDKKTTATDVKYAGRKRNGKKSSLTKNQRMIMTGLFAVCMVAIGVSVFMIGMDVYQNKTNGEKITSDINVFENPETVPAEEIENYDDIVFPVGMLPNFKPFYAKSDDVVGWVQIDGLTNFAYPVVQTDNNTDYFRKNLSGKYSKEGTAFIDYRCNIDDMTNQNILIYGHNNKNGLMFAALTKYNAFKNGLSAYKAAPILTFYTLYAKAEYKICAVFVANVNESDGPIFNYLETDLSDKAKFETFAADLKKRSIIDIPVDIQYGDTLITLSTCTYEFKNARMVVVARSLRDGETPDVDISKATLNTKAVMPDAYVTAYNVGVKLGS